jgi:hypothetical protein
MLSKSVLVSVACGIVATASLLGCAGPIGKGEGDSCSTADDCGSDLTCYAPRGKTQNYCCPTQGAGAPAPKSSNCDPASDAGQ